MFFVVLLITLNSVSNINGDTLFASYPGEKPKDELISQNRLKRNSDFDNEDDNGSIIRAAAGQYKVETTLESNLEKIDSMLKYAVKAKVDVVVFPECGLTGYPPRDKTTLDYVHQEKTERALEILKQKAKRFNITIVIGAAWKDAKEDVWRNRAFLIDEDGEVLGYYDKIHGTDFEHNFFVDGERLPTFHWRGIKVGILICADMRYPEVWRLMRMDEVHLMFHCSAAFGDSEWKVPVLEGTMRCRAAENGYNIVSCNNAGPIPMMVSGIYNPDGLILAQANYANEELIIADIDVRELEGWLKSEEKSNIYQLKKVSKQ